MNTATPSYLLHGLSANSTSWAPVIARTAREWRSYALDLRGHGRSARTPGRYRLDDYIDDADRLLQVIGEPAVVVGHSLGAVVAASLAQDRHPLVAAVFLEDPPLYVVDRACSPAAPRPEASPCCATTSGGCRPKEPRSRPTGTARRLTAPCR